MKNKWQDHALGKTFPGAVKILLKMKLTLCIILISFLGAMASESYSQTTKLSLDLKNAKLKDALEAIENQSEFFFLYSEKLIDVNRKVNIEVTGSTIEKILNEIFEGTDVNYTVKGRQIVLATPEANFGMPSGNQQQKKVTGKVTDASGASLPGVSVVVKGTTIGVVTDNTGNYSLVNISENATIQFSFIGMKGQEITIKGKSTINVTLAEETIGLDEVVAIGYGIQKKVNLTGSVSSISGDQIAKRPVTNPTTMLQGSVPGLRIVQGVGQPGAEDVSIQVRGQGTYSSAGNNPLILIDGVQGSLTNLNANDIESVSVLKDAASAALYGSKAANGVLLVTTKTGVKGKLKIDFNANVGIHTPTKMLDLVTNSAQYMTLANEARKNSGLSQIYTQEMIDTYKNATDKNKYPDFDWLGYMFNPATVKIYNLSLNGGNETTTYNISAGYTDQPGTMRGFSYKKYNFRTNLKSQIKPWATIGTNLSLERGDIISTRQGQNDAFLSTLAQAPTYGPFLPDGSGKATYSAYDTELHNKNVPAMISSGAMKNETNYDISSQLWADIKIAKGLTWYSKAAFNLADYSYKDWKPKVPVYNYLSGEEVGTLDVGGSGLDVYNSRNFYSNFFTYLKYDFKKGNHEASIQTGYSQEYNKFEYLQGQRSSYNFNLTELNAGNSSNQNAYGTSNEWAIRSYFSRFNYSYKNKYLVEANARYDGSSRISSDNRWGMFPSFSAGWRLTEEQFIKNLSLRWLNNAKIRASYGVLGNQNIGNYPFQNMLSLTGQYSYDNSNLQGGVAQTKLSNTNIKWESTSIQDIGIDLTIFKGLSIIYDYYYKHTYDILRGAQVNALVGLDAPTVNKGEMVNFGHEFAIEYNHSHGDWSYSGGFSVDLFRSKLKNWGADEFSTNDHYMNRNGLPYNSFYVLDVIGIFQDQNEISNSPVQFGGSQTHAGEFKYRDANKDGKIDNNDYVVVSGRIPKFEYAFHGNASWKGFDASFVFQGVQGRKIYTDLWGYNTFTQGTSVTKDWVDNRWTEENHSTTYPRLLWGWDNYDNGRPNTWNLQNASYLRLKNLTVGYTIPHLLTQKVKIQKARIYFSGDNLFIITKYKYLDPERTSDGRFAQYPQNKIVSFGLNIEF